jgi:hypothetical protein
MVVAIYLVYLGTSISSRLAAPRQMACEESTQQETIEIISPLFWKDGMRIRIGAWAGGGSDAEHLTCALPLLASTILDP